MRTLIRREKAEAEAERKEGEERNQRQNRNAKRRGKTTTQTKRERSFRERDLNIMNINKDDETKEFQAKTYITQYMLYNKRLQSLENIHFKVFSRVQQSKIAVWRFACDIQDAQATTHQYAALLR